ncbi:MAG: hypothetical protein H6509_13795 [Bryobacterales bacterium]|nr:hypothetical protein [Acidobacteriota bacterium]MCB9385683.1 hypothetical protein [Bryobacterales bacterium]
MPSVQTRLAELQRRIGVKADGLLGPVTLTRLEELVAIALPQVEEPPEWNLLVTQSGLEQIVRFEIGSEASYRRTLQTPVWPGAQSGVTIGIGYDVGHTARSRIEQDWRGRLPDADLERLLAVAGVQGQKAKNALPSVADILTPFEAARAVFFRRTLPFFAAQTRRTFPGVDELPADAQAMLLSLVFNRGGATAGARRAEMKAIQTLVPTGDLAGIATQVRAMKRLWDETKLPGLHTRRDREAELIEAADRDYSGDTLVRL